VKFIPSAKGAASDLRLVSRWQTTPL